MAEKLISKPWFWFSQETRFRETWSKPNIRNRTNKFERLKLEHSPSVGVMMLTSGTSASSATTIMISNPLYSNHSILI